jgi:hypothetical protein
MVHCFINKVLFLVCFINKVLLVTQPWPFTYMLLEIALGLQKQRSTVVTKIV